MGRGLMVAAAVAALLGCGDDDRGTPLEQDAASCSNGRDDDGDFLVDCQEPACRIHAFCADGPDAGRLDAGPGRPDAAPIDAPSVCDEPVDVVFVMDVSTSMMDEVESIRAGVDSIWAATAALTADHRMSLVVFVDDVVAVNGCMPFASVAEVQAELARWRDFTSGNAQPGGSRFSNTDCAENSLDALYTAATMCSWRPGATHIAIHVTDDTFAERPALLAADPFFGGGIPVASRYDEVVAALRAAEVRVGAFAAPGAGEFCGVTSSPDVGRGFHAPYMGMPSLPEATGGRAWSIRDVRAGTLDMAEAVNAFTADEYCTLF